jgi:spore coat protein A, manganese oxidase
MVSRREFLKRSAIVGASLAVPFKWLSAAQAAYAYAQSGGLKKFIQPLRQIGTDIKLAVPDAVNPGWWQPGVTHYTIDIGQYEDLLHPDLPNETRLFGYGQGFDPGNPHWTNHLGGVIAAKRGQPVQITFRNHLPAEHILPVDTSIMGADQARNRADIHLHGGFVPWTSDGGPQAWWDPHGNHGDSFVNVLNPKLAPNEAEYYYPNDQGARLMWYHDHTFGLTRLNAYAGMATGYVIYDDYEISLITNNHLPAPVDSRTEYLVFQDKIFVSGRTETDDPSWFDIMPHTRQGDLWYAHIYEPSRWDLVPGKTPPETSAIPEFFGDTILVNGAVYPFLEVEPRQYRFRLLNACNARFLNPRLVYAQDDDPTEPNPTLAGPEFVQFGTEAGFLPAPVTLDGTSQLLLLAPAERADLIVDFRDVPVGSNLILYNDAPAPYPMGDDSNDYYPGNPSNPTNPDPGFGPNTRTLLQIRVKQRIGPANAEITLPSVLTPTDPLLIEPVPGTPTEAPEGIKVRYLTLNEDFDDLGRLIQKLGTDEAVLPGAFGREYLMEPTEVIQAGTMEVWEIINLTGDTHPIHFHLVNAQVLSRQPLTLDGLGNVIYSGGVPTYSGPATAPDLNELGWKETVRMNPGEVTRVLMKFDLPKTSFTIPESPRTGGHEYVWHCHILEHEEHDMMRPMIVQENKIFMPNIHG